MYTLNVYKAGTAPSDLQCGSSAATEYNCVRDNGDNSSGSYHAGTGTDKCQFQHLPQLSLQ